MLNHLVDSLPATANRWLAARHGFQIHTPQTSFRLGSANTAQRRIASATSDRLWAAK